MAIELAKAYVQIIPTTRGITAELNDQLNRPAEEAGDTAGKKSGSKFVDAMKKMIVAAGIGKIIQSAISEGADLEQSYFGGLDTLYGDAADKAREFANEAAAFGVSMNDYAEQAVSFGAALKSAYGGDTVKAAEAANTAIKDMADNSAKMGTDIESVQAAYQGFAKGQYQLLDNLKLGYGGTKTEMERLLADAEKFSGVKYDINNLGDVYDAIHVIQGELGLTGVAADEAATTISGSMSSMQASWSNVLAVITTGGDISSAFESLKNSAVAFANNIIPAVGNVLEAIPTLITDVLSEGLPLLVTKGTELIVSLTSGLKDTIPTLLDTITNELIPNLLSSILDATPLLIQAGVDLLVSLISDLPTIISQIVGQIPILIDSICKKFTSMIPQIVSAGVTLFVSLIQNLPQIIVEIVKAIPQIIASIVKGFTGFYAEMADTGFNLIKGIWNGISNAASWLWNLVKGWCNNLVGKIKGFFGIHSPSTLFAGIGDNLMLGLAGGIDDGADSVYSAIDRVTAATMGGINGSMTVNSALSMPEYKATSRMDEMISRLENLRIYLDGDTLVGGIAGRMDNTLGINSGLAERGLA